MAVKFFNMTRADFLSKKLLYKYMPLERVLEMLTNQTLWFANPTIWKDPFEKRFIENKYEIDGAQRNSHGKIVCTVCVQHKQLQVRPIGMLTQLMR